VSSRRVADHVAMSLADHFYALRDWVPVPVDGVRVEIVRWVLLEANRRAVTGALLTLTFVSMLALGNVWTFEMQRLFTETDSVQTVLNSLLSGIILLVSVVVSINSIVLTYDITAISTQRERVQGTTEYRREIGQMVRSERSPTDPRSFLELMTHVMQERAEDLQETVTRDNHEEFAEAVDEFVDSLETSIRTLEDPREEVGGADFGTLWLGLEADFGRLVDELQTIRIAHAEEIPDEEKEEFDKLMEAFELFETGRQYFKTLYYSREISELSRTLLVISFPSILVTAWTIMAIDAGTIPGFGLFGLPPLQVFLATSFTISLAPYLVLTAYVLRTATVARRTAAGGPFVLD